MDDVKRLRGGIHISRVTGGGQEDQVRIQVVDELSRCQAMELNMSVADFADVLFGTERPCEYAPNNKNVGKTLEYKEERVLVPDGHFEHRREIAEKACKAFEVDGWVAHVNDAMNHHRRIPTNTVGDVSCYNVHFDRWVETKEV